MTAATALHLDDLVAPRLLRESIEAGHVRRAEHPDLPLAILNYTAKAAYDCVWNDATRRCRGLIVDAGGGVVARPFPKFFNYGQPDAPLLDLDAPVAVTDKLDGSLGILYPAGDGHAVATRGSFTSDQALHATEVWRRRYADRNVRPGLTYLFEIVFPQNRVVVDYGDLDDLVLLDALDTATGVPVDPEWTGPRAAAFDYATLREALEAKPRDNCEGLVVYFPDANERLKIKQDDYVALHRIVTGLSARVVWEHLREGRPLGELLEPLPDEFHPWVQATAAGLAADVERQLELVRGEHDAIVAALPPGFGRKDYALRAKESPLAWGLFMLLDGRDPTAVAWRNAKPSGNVAPRSFGEDTA